MLLNYIYTSYNIRTAMVRRRHLIASLFCCAFAVVIVVRVEATKKPPLHPINLNTASSTELQEVPGIGPVTADKILKMRKSYGPFKSVDDLRAIKGIGPKRLEKMRKYLTVAKPVPKKASQQPAKASPAKNNGQSGADASPEQ
jgi:comEA protein